MNILVICLIVGIASIPFCFCMWAKSLDRNAGTDDNTIGSQ
jgi:hypothetical protein